MPLDADKVADGIFEVVSDYVSRRVEPLEKRVAELERRLAEAEQVKFRGVWNKHVDYAAGSFVTRDGSVWHADKASRGVAPGSNPEFWTLAVKSGERRVPNIA